MASQALAASGVVQARAARSLGVDPSRVGDWYDPEHESTLQTGDLLALPYEDAARILAALTAANELRRRPVTLPAVTAAVVALHDAGSLVAEGAKALLDGRVDADEARDLSRVADRLESSVAQLRAALHGIREE